MNAFTLNTRISSSRVASKKVKGDCGKMELKWFSVFPLAPRNSTTGLTQSYEYFCVSLLRLAVTDWPVAAIQSYSSSIAIPVKCIWYHNKICNDIITSMKLKCLQEKFNCQEGRTNDRPTQSNSTEVSGLKEIEILFIPGCFEFELYSSRMMLLALVWSIGLSSCVGWVAWARQEVPGKRMIQIE